MISNKNVIAIIPARGGSKGIPRKNIRLLAGKPLIAYTTEAALQSEYLDRIIVSTDDEEIAEITKSFGAEVPFLRPMELARDDSPTIDVLIHAIEWLENNDKYIPDIIVLLQPTSPLTIAKDIDTAIELYIEKKADAVVSVCEAEHSPYWMHKIENGRLVDFVETIYESRRQDLPTVYRRNGAIWIASKDILMRQKTFFTGNTYGYIMPYNRSVEIDTLLDMKLVEVLIKENNLTLVN